MKTHRAPTGTVFFDFHHSDAPLLHSLFNRVTEGSPLGDALLSRFCDGKFATFHVFDGEQEAFAALIDSAKSDLSEEMAQGGHDGKIGSERESEQLLELLDRLGNLVHLLPGDGHADR